MDNLHLTLIQSAIYWENAAQNQEHFGRLIDQVNEPVDLIILPEMFNTGFSINPPQCAETMDGASLAFLKEKAFNKQSLIITSLLIDEKEHYFNRLVVCYPDGSVNQYDKRHLFRLSDEYKIFSPGKEKITATYKGWNICPLICYDLRFPVWSKNRLIKEEYEYDLLVYVANWPKIRSHIWKPLLIARAIENQCYVIGVNRTGDDGYQRPHVGDSLVIGPEGEILASAEGDENVLINATLPMKQLRDFRKKNPFAADWDQFTPHV